MTLILLLALMFICAVVPAVLFVLNLRTYVPPPDCNISPLIPAISVLIPARNEAANIGDALACVLASTAVRLEAIVLDDASTDDTGVIVEQLAAQDPRIRLLRSRALPAGWNGKQHACWQLANHATAPIMMYLDADVRLAPEALARMAAFQQSSGAALVSGFPRLITIGFLEWLLLPLIHFVLLGFLPIARMRKSTDAAMAAGCGQFMMVERDAYFASGGHQAIRSTMHDGLLLPRTLRNAGFRTDLADITDLASVRMYDSAAKVWQGLAKNATEGIAHPARIVPISAVLLLGQVLPLIAAFLFAALGWKVFYRHGQYACAAWILAGAVCFTSFLPRFLATRRFRQPLKSALLHPLGVLLLLSIQWYALIRRWMGRPVGWRQRDYTSTDGTEVAPSA